MRYYVGTGFWIGGAFAGVGLLAQFQNHGADYYDRGDVALSILIGLLGGVAVWGGIGAGLGGLFGLARRGGRPSAGTSITNPPKGAEGITPGGEQVPVPWATPADSSTAAPVGCTTPQTLTSVPARRGATRKMVLAVGAILGTAGIVVALVVFRGAGTSAGTQSQSDTAPHCTIGFTINAITIEFRGSDALGGCDYYMSQHSDTAYRIEGAVPGVEVCRYTDNKGLLGIIRAGTEYSRGAAQSMCDGIQGSVP